MSQHFQMQCSESEPGGGRSGSRQETGRPRAGRRRALDMNLGATGRAALEQVVQRAVVPMLVAMPWMGDAVGPAPVRAAQTPARAATALVASPAPSGPVPEGSVARLVSLSLEADGLAVAAMVAGLHDTGVTPETIYTELLTPAARRLGEMWENDECSFADVTMGVLRLQNAQRALAPAFLGTTKVGKGAPRVLLMPVPGEQHTFGLTLVADFFTRAGWDTWTGMIASEKLALAMVRTERVDLVGLSFACDDRIDSAARLIAAFRRRAANPAMLVMVGGPSFVADPGLAARVGADATAADGHEAVMRANELLHRRARSLPEASV